MKQKGYFIIFEVNNCLRLKSGLFTLMYVGFLEIRFVVGQRGAVVLKLYPCLFEIWNLVCKYTHIFCFTKYTF